MHLSGRPLKYAHVIEMLEDDNIYAPGTIAQFAKVSGLLPELTTVSLARLRIAMCRLKAYHNFPEKGDGLIRMPGQQPFPAWFGWRWKLLIMAGKS